MVEGSTSAANLLLLCSVGYRSLGHSGVNNYQRSADFRTPALLLASTDTPRKAGLGCITLRDDAQRYSDTVERLSIYIYIDMCVCEYMHIHIHNAHNTFLYIYIYVRIYLVILIY